MRSIGTADGSEHVIVASQLSSVQKFDTWCK